VPSDIESLFSIIIKLMNEKYENLSIYNDEYYKLVKKINEDLPAILDSGLYIDNASIIRRIKSITQIYNIIFSIPNLVGKYLISIIGTPSDQLKFLNKLIPNMDHIKYNAHIPYLILPSDGQENKIFAISYCDKIIELTQSEFIILTRYSSKQNINIKKLIKLFVGYHSFDSKYNGYLLIPNYIDIGDNYLSYLCEKIEKQIIIYNKVLSKKIIDYYINKDVKTYLIGDFQRLRENYNLRRNQNILSFYEEMDSLESLDPNNHLINYNFNISTDIELILSEVEQYYYNKLTHIKEKLAQLRVDKFRTSDENLKKYIIKYEKDITNKFNEYEYANETLKIKHNELLKQITDYENEIRKFISQFHDDEFDYKKICTNYLKLFLSKLNQNEFEVANTILLFLKRIKYEYFDLCEYYLEYKQTNKLNFDAIKYICDLPKNEIFNKIKIELSNQLNLTMDEVLELVLLLNQIDSGKEYYYYGISMVKDKNYDLAIDFLFKALELGYYEAGNTLLDISNQIEANNVDFFASHYDKKVLEYLADYLVPEACYKFALEKCKRNSRKFNFSLKIAAAQAYIPAIELLVDKYYKSFMSLSENKLKNKSIQLELINIIMIYGYLKKHSTDKKDYQLRIGSLYYKKQDFSKSFNILKYINSADAKYLCAKMYAEGNGVGQDIVKARKIFKEISGYKDSSELFDKLNKQIIKIKSKQKKTYKENKDYNSTSRVVKSDSNCFITTATCLALNKGDDCDELNVLRLFRDKYIINDDNDGIALVEEYYRIGPILVKYIDKESNPLSIYLMLWMDYIKPSYKLLNERRYSEAKMKYILMVKMLCEKYNVNVKPDIKERYGINVY